MDGNGRWAQRQGFLRTLGHREGSEAVRRIVRACRRLGIESLTLYAFSEQNWSRPSLEVTALMELLKEFLISEREELLEKGIRLRSIGRRHRLPDHVGDVLDEIVDETRDLDRMTLTLALSYGGHEEIADAAKDLARRAVAGELDPDTIDAGLFGETLPSMDVGPVDLLIRTSGELRISNFLLWSCAYAELYFTETLWPDFDERDLFEALSAYQMRDRRFGRIASAAKDELRPLAEGDDPKILARAVHV